ncbi:MAG TPA: sensor domain-containing diguanylate cyclase [Mycobacteriales bacterium]|nr:sensor domain-containing diguanylate cyclase [Mycobacteriales bacterium]
MSATAHATSGQDLVPLAERVRYLLGFRAVASVAVLAYAWLARAHVDVDLGDVVLLTAGYAALVGAAHGVWRALGSRALILLGVILLLDGLFIACASYLTGGVGSPLRHLAIVHLAMVALLASHRTGLKLALWHSLLLFIGYQLQQSGQLASTVGLAGVADDRAGLHLAGYIAAFWLIAIVTATFSSVNERELRRRRYDLEALASLASALEATQDAQEVGAELVRATCDAFDATRVVLVADRGDGARVLATLGDASSVESAVVAFPGSVMTRCHENHAPVLSAGLDPTEDAWLAAMLPDAGNLIVIPMTVEARPVGTLVVEHNARLGSRVERRVVSMLERFASQAALALRGAWLVEKIQAQAALDGLTGIANRRSFDAALELEVARARRTGTPFSLILFDIDHFKKLNDTHGHQTGDQVLRDIGALLRERCRDIDTVARYGGEEFAVIMPGCPNGAALETAQRLLVDLAAAPTAAQVTASAGVATWQDATSFADNLVAAADAALYRSKRAGRNRATAAAGSADGAEAPARASSSP